MTITVTQPPAVFAGLDPNTWTDYAVGLRAMAKTQMGYLASGKPVPRGKAQAYAALYQSVKQLYGFTGDEAWVATNLVGTGVGYLRSSLEYLLDAAPLHLQDAADAAAAYVADHGMPVVLPDLAVQAIAARTQQAITADWTNLTYGFQSSIADSLRYAVTAGTGARQAADLMGNAAYNVVGYTHAKALTIARTELADAYHLAELTTYKQAGTLGYSWYSSLDDRTCGLCLALHGRVFLLNDAPDQHHNCRCTMLPVFGDEDLKEAMDGAVYVPAQRIPNSVIQERLPKSWGPVTDINRVALIGQKPSTGDWRPTRGWLGKPSPDGLGVTPFSGAPKPKPTLAGEYLPDVHVAKMPPAWQAEYKFSKAKGLPPAEALDNADFAQFQAFKAQGVPQPLPLPGPAAPDVPGQSWDVTRYDTLHRVVSEGPVPGVPMKVEGLTHSQVSSAADAIEQYTQVPYKAMNGRLRGTLYPHEYASDATLDRWSSSLTAYMNAVPGVSEELVMLRGVWGYFADTIRTVQPGYVHTERGFLSTTTKRSTAKGFTGYDEGGVLWQVRVPPGTRGLRGNGFEQEFIAAPGARLRFLGWAKYQGSPLMRWELLPPAVP